MSEQPKDSLRATEEDQPEVAARKVIGDRIVVACAACREGTSFPNKGMGRAYAATWMTRHQHVGSPGQRASA